MGSGRAFSIRTHGPRAKTVQSEGYKIHWLATILTTRTAATKPRLCHTVSSERHRVRPDPEYSLGRSPAARIMAHSNTPPRSHEPHPFPPSGNADLRVTGPDLKPLVFAVADLRRLPAIAQTDCFIVSTGHGASGPFRFEGPTLATLAFHCGITDFAGVRVAGGDGFFTLLTAPETTEARTGSTAMLALTRDGMALTREQGLVRLVVPTEKRDALKQIKWVSHIDFQASRPHWIPDPAP